MSRTARRRVAVSIALVLALAFVVAPAALLQRARSVRRQEESSAARSGKAIEDTLAAVLARLAARSPPFSGPARREESTFWLAVAASGERVEARLGATRRLSRRIARAYSDAIRADAAWAAPRAVPRLNARSRFDLAGRKRGAVLERRLAAELALARALSGQAPAACHDGLDRAVARMSGVLLGAAPSSTPPALRPALEAAARGHDDRALAALGGGGVTAVARGLVLLRAGRALEAESSLAEAAGSVETASLRPRIATARALARLGMGRPDDALLVLGTDAAQPSFAAIRLVASFVTGDTAGARAALRRIPDGAGLAELRDEIEPALVMWMRDQRAQGRARIAHLIASRPDDWDFLLPLARFATGHLDDLDAWLERAAPRDPFARVWQLYALERAARERDNPARAAELAVLRRRICR